MSIDVYWSPGSPYCWRVLLALELKGLAYHSHRLDIGMQQHKAPQMLAMTPRGRLPVLRDEGYVVFESLAVLYYLDLKYPSPPLFGHSPEEAAVIMRVINEFQAYTEADVMRIIDAVLRRRPAMGGDALTHAMHVIASEARTIEGRLAKGDWIVGDAVSAADLMIYPCIRLLHRALMRPEARELSARFLPAQVHYPGLARWMQRVEGLPGYERTTGVELPWKDTDKP
ncbi:MAG: glutathione S-transferase family protein [Nevskiaceae bacterium]|jgi:glutathione S-transferase|nr:glutathione S-transferase family protein [Nevskiaceae bacterium]